MQTGGFYQPVQAMYHVHWWVHVLAKSLISTHEKIIMSVGLYTELFMLPSLTWFPWLFCNLYSSLHFFNVF